MERSAAVLPNFISLLIILSGITTFVRSACLQDVLTFLNSSDSCRFTKNDFAFKFIDVQQECVSNCSLSSSVPSYGDWQQNRYYEIKDMTIFFSRIPYEFAWDVSCTSYRYDKISLTFICEGRYFYERGIGETCNELEQCKAVNPNSTCNLANRKCSCREGYFWNSSTCIEALGLDKHCKESKQCQEITADSTCNTDSSKCECQQGFIQKFDSCLPTRKLDEPCVDPIQCLVTNPNSTCNETTNVCQCKEGYLKVLNTCSKGRLLLDEMCDSYAHSGISDDEQTDIENVCSTYFGAGVNPVREISQNRYIGAIVGVGLAGVLFGIVLCSVVFFFLIRRIKDSQKRFEMNKLENTGEQMQRVQVSGDVKSRAIVRTKNSDDTEENGIYNHLHENPIELQEVQSDYDHCPSQTATEDMYSHLASGYDNSDNYFGDYGEIN